MLQANIIGGWFYGTGLSGAKHFRCASEIMEEGSVTHEYGEATYDTTLPLPLQQGKLM